MSKSCLKPAALAIIAGLSLLAAPVAASEPVLQSFIYTAADGRTIPAERGSFRVPENRAVAGSRQIEIGFVRLGSTAARPGAPIVYLAGGPGGSGIATLDGPRQSMFLALRAVADVILIDQRGVGRSDAIPDCAAEAPFDLTSPLTEANYAAYYRATLDRCLAQWREAGVDIQGYTTDQSADDLEDLRQALGARRLNLLGISYGTHLGLAMLRRHPQSVERLALASVEGMGQTVKSPAALDRALERFVTRAGHSPGDEPLIEVMRRVHRTYAQPREVSLRAPDGQTYPIMVDAFPIRMIAGFLAKNPGGLPTLEAFYRSLDAGQTEMLAGMAYGFLASEPLSLDGMPQAMDIASGISPDRLERYRREAEGSLLGLATNFPMPQLVGAIPGLDAGEDYRREVRSGRPVLVISGDLDVRTPVEEQQAAVAGLSDRRVLTVRGGGHDVLETDPRVTETLAAFFAGREVADATITLEDQTP